jgi:hypothetical protein
MLIHQLIIELLRIVNRYSLALHHDPNPLYHYELQQKTIWQYDIHNNPIFDPIVHHPIF